jgi:hypothetical protein
MRRGPGVQDHRDTQTQAYEAPKLSRLGKIEEWTKGSVFAQVVQISVIVG